MDFSQLKNMSGRASLDALTTELNKLNSKTEEKKYQDDRYWVPSVDKAGNGYAVIRFLPGHGEENNTMWVRLWDHGFKGPSGKWYIENSLTSIDQKDPVGEYNSYLWNLSTDDNSPSRKQARQQKRRLHFISNILVVQDPANPENEGKVFLYKYGKKIFDKLNDLMNPSFPDEEPVNPFHMWEGANFVLKIRNVEGYRNYDKSEFQKPSPISNDDADIEKVWRLQHKLKPFLAPENFKSYDELKAKLNMVLEIPSSTIAKAKEEEAPWTQEEAAPTFKSSNPAFNTSDDDEDDDMNDFLSKLKAS
jgi:hypothetical protein